MIWKLQYWCISGCKTYPPSTLLLTDNLPLNSPSLINLQAALFYSGRGQILDSSPFGYKCSLYSHRFECLTGWSSNSFCLHFPNSKFFDRFLKIYFHFDLCYYEDMFTKISLNPLILFSELNDFKVLQSVRMFLIIHNF